MVSRANKKLWILRRLKNMGAKDTDLVEMYTKQIICLLELAAPAWHGAITMEERTNIEDTKECSPHYPWGGVYLI